MKNNNKQIYEGKMLKSMRIMAGILGLLCAVTFLPQVSCAAVWVTVSVNKVGPTTDGDIACGYFDHEDSSPIFTNQWLKFEAPLSNQMLATTLTAATLEKNLRIRIKDDGLTIDKMYLDFE